MSNQSLSAKPVIDLILAFRYSKILFAAVDLGIFDNLDGSDLKPGRTAEEVSSTLSSDLNATTDLLDASVSLGLLAKTASDGKTLYANSELAEKFLVSKNPDSLAGYVRYSNKQVYPLFGNLEFAVRDGKNQWERTFNKPESEIWSNLYENEKRLFDFVEAMNNSMKPSTHWISTAFDLSRFSQMCDLGGAGGALAYTMCTNYPKLRVAVFDLPQVARIAPQLRPSLSDCPNRENVSFIAGDLFKDNFPSADVYVMCRILHDWNKEKGEILLQKIYKQLPSGGAVLIGEALLSDDRSGPKEVFACALNMLVVLEGREMTADQYTELLMKNGFTDVQVKPHPVPGFLGAIFGVKP